MSEKIAKLGIQRDNDLMYYIKGGDVWATPRKRPGMPKGKAQKIQSVGIDLDYSNYLYFLDSDGDVARKARASGGRRSKAPKAPKAAKAAPRAPKAAASSGGGKKSEAQIAREVDECLEKTAAHAHRRR